MRATHRLLVILGCAALCVDTAHADNRRHEFMWNQANAQMAEAESREDFLQAAESYMDLVEDGVRNGPLFYNLGTALLGGELYEPAARTLCRAERYMGSNPDIRRNLALALARGDPHAELALPWYRTFLFWHYALRVPVKSAVCSIAFLLLWLGIAMRSFGARRIAGPLIWVAAVILIVMGSSVVTALHQESVERNREWQDRKTVATARSSADATPTQGAHAP